MAHQPGSALVCIVALIVVCLSQVSLASVADVEALLEAERIGEAMESLSTHLDAHPDDVVGHELFIDLLLTAEQFDQANRFYTDRVTRADTADNWYLLGRASMDQAEALTAFDRALSLQPEHARAWMGQASVQRSLSQYSDAAIGYAKALQFDQTLSEAWIGLWSAQLSQGSRDEAVATMSRASRSVPHVIEPWLALAEMNHEQAISILQEGITHSPDSTWLWTALAQHAFRSRGLALATSTHQRAIELAPSDKKLRINEAILEEISAGRLSWDAAHTVLDTRSSPQDPQTLIGMDQVVASAPQSTIARMVRGNLRQIQDDHAGAEADLRGALELDPTDINVSAALGLLLLNQKRASEAITHLNRAYAARPEDLGLGIASAIALAEGHDPGAGGIRLLELQTRFPHDPGPPKILAQLLMAMGQYDRAYTILLDAITTIPDTTLILFLAEAAHRTGRDIEAAAALETLTERTGDHRFSEAAQRLMTETIPTQP